MNANDLRMHFATLTNRSTGKSTRVKTHLSASCLVYITSRQYNAALKRIGAGQFAWVRTNISLVVYTAAGLPVAHIDARS